MTIKLFNYIHGNINEGKVFNGDISTILNDDNVIYTEEDVNFEYNDGINFSAIVNCPDDKIESVNYMLLVGDKVIPYYITAYHYNTQDQYTISGKIDSVQYKLEDIKNSKAHIDRGFISESNPLIYNNEAVNANKIKVSETPIQENIKGVRADVGYYAVFMDAETGSTWKEGEDHKLTIATNKASFTVTGTYPDLDSTPFGRYVDNKHMWVDTTTRTVSLKYMMTIYNGVPASGWRELISKQPVRRATFVYNYNNDQSQDTFIENDGNRYTYKPVSTLWDKVSDGNWFVQQEEYASFNVNYYPSNFIINSPVDTFVPELTVLNNSIKSVFSNTVYDGSGLIAGGMSLTNLKENYVGKYFNIGGITYQLQLNTLKQTGYQVLSNSVTNMRDVLKDVYIANGDYVEQDNGNINLDTDAEFLRQKLSFEYVKQGQKYREGVTVYPYELPVAGDLPDVSLSYGVELTFGLLQLVRVESIQEAKVYYEFAKQNGSARLNAVANDRPYKVLLFPYGNIKLRDDTGIDVDWFSIISKEVVLSVVNNIMINHPTATFDVQEIPYGSIDLNNYITSVDTRDETLLIEYDFEAMQEAVDDETNFIISGDRQMYTFFNSIQGQPMPDFIMFTAFSATRSFDVKFDNFVKKDLKVDDSTRTSVIMSPSMKSGYEYQFVKNGYLKEFIVNVDLRPVVSYFNIDYPSGSELIAPYYADGRGLNISEDMSVTRVTDGFIEYQRNNYNYLNSFNSSQEYSRDAMALSNQQALAVLNKQEGYNWQTFALGSLGRVAPSIGGGAGALISQQSNINALNNFKFDGVQSNLFDGSEVLVGDMRSYMNTLSGTGLGSIASGGAVGAGIGALANVGFGAINTALSNQHNKSMMTLQQGQAREQLALSQQQASEQFNYNIGNIANRPNRLDKVSGITVLNKKSAFVSEYDCTSVESSLLIDRFAEIGYTIGKVDILKNYIDIEREVGYISGRIITFAVPINAMLLQDITTRLNVGLKIIKE